MSGPAASPAVARLPVSLVVATAKPSSWGPQAARAHRRSVVWPGRENGPLVEQGNITNGNEVAVVAARKVARLLRDLETYVCGQSDIIIDYATARRQEEPIPTAVTESTVQWLLHHRMNAQQQMRWSPRGAHLMLKVRTAIANGTLERDHAVAGGWARRPIRRAA
jgi:hypothetical protein